VTVSQQLLEAVPRAGARFGSVPRLEAAQKAGHVRDWEVAPARETRRRCLAADRQSRDRG